MKGGSETERERGCVWIWKWWAQPCHLHFFHTDTQVSICIVFQYAVISIQKPFWILKLCQRWCYWLTKSVSAVFGFYPSVHHYECQRKAPWWSHLFAGTSVTMIYHISNARTQFVYTCVCDDSMCSAVWLCPWSISETGASSALINSSATSDIPAFISPGDH